MFCLARRFAPCVRGDRFCCSASHNGHLREGRHGLWGWWTSCSHQLYCLNGTGCFCCFMRNWFFQKIYEHEELLGWWWWCCCFGWFPGRRYLPYFLMFWISDTQVQYIQVLREFDRPLYIDLVLRYSKTPLQNFTLIPNMTPCSKPEIHFSELGMLNFRGVFHPCFFLEFPKWIWLYIVALLELEPGVWSWICLFQGNSFRTLTWRKDPRNSTWLITMVSNIKSPIPGVVGFPSIQRKTWCFSLHIFKS